MEFIIEEFSKKHLDYLDSFFTTLSNLTEAPKQTRERTQELLLSMNEQGIKVFVAMTPDNEIVGSIALMIEQKMLR